MISIPWAAVQAILEEGYVYMNTPRGKRKLTIDDLIIPKEMAVKLEAAYEKLRNEGKVQ